MRELDFLFLFIPLVHGKIDDPGEFEPILIDKLELLADLGAREPGEFAEFVRIAGDKERRVAHGEFFTRFAHEVAGEAPPLVPDQY